MSVAYNYDATSDFINAVILDISTIQESIIENGIIVQTIENITRVGDNVKMTFAASLSSAEKTELDSIVTNYVYDEPITDNVDDAIGVTLTDGIKSMKISTHTSIDGDLKLSGPLIIKNISAPGNAVDGQGSLYKKTGNDGLFWKPDAAGVEIDLTTAPQYVRTAITSNQSPYTILATDEIVGIDTSAGPVIVTLPRINTIEGSNNYRKYYIVDEGGHSSINNITVITSGIDTINKNNNGLTVNVDHMSVTLYNDGTSNWIIL